MNIRFLIALAAILFSASSNADWDSRFFPTTNAPLRSGGDFAFDVVASQMVWAVNERYWAVKKNQGWLFAEEPIERGPRFYEEVMLDVKAGLRSIIGDFLDISAMTNGPNELIYHTPVGLLSRLALPEDYFDVVPVRNPMGHDWPTNNPSGQKGKDYGWHGLYMILTNLTHTLEGGFLKEKFEDRYNFAGGPLTCSISTESNFPRNISSYVGGAIADDYFATGAYIFPSENLGADFALFDLSISSGIIGRKAAWLYNKEAAGVRFAYLDATAERWVQQVGFSLNLSGFAEIFDRIRGQLEAACPNVFYEEVVWTFDGITSSTTILDDGNFLKTTETSSLAVPCSASSLFQFAEDAGGDGTFVIGSRCDPDLEFNGSASRSVDVSAEQNYAHILGWNFRYK